MKLEKILDNLNSFEKNSFLKIIDSILADQPKNAKAVEKILSETSKDLKAIDSQNIAKVFSLLETEFKECIKTEFVNTTSQLDILIDIISREGNAIMKQDWFARLYEKELNLMDKRLKQFKHNLENEKSELDEKRRRDYLIYKKCIHTAYFNDENNNQEKKITTDEQAILLTLAQQLELSQEEVKLINYLIIPAKKLQIDTVINDLKSIGVIFYSKKTNTIYIADEIVTILRKVRGKEISDKFFRRVLKSLKETQINQICRKHGIDRKLSQDQKIKQIINEGISFRGILQEDIHKEELTLSDRKKYLNDFFDNTLKITPPIKGVLIEEKVDNLIDFYESLDKDDKIGISVDGYEKMLRELGQALPKFNNFLKEQYEFQEENVLNSHFLLDYNIKPRDILEIISINDLQEFCKIKEIKTRGDLIQNILESFKDAENLYLENYENIGFRNMAALKGNSIDIKEADIGVKFEELTKRIFSTLGFNVDEELRASLNSVKDKADILLKISNNEIIIVECKTVKENGYNKFSTVSRQLKSYANRINGNNYKVVKSILVAPDFSDEFIKECGLEYELNLSLITASTLIRILEGFKSSKLKKFPHNLLMRDVLIQEDRVLKAIGR